MDSIFTTLFDLQFSIAAFQEIVDVIQVEFHKTDSDCKLSFPQPSFNIGKDVFYCQIEVSLLLAFASEDGVSFACAGLAIGEEGGVVALKDGFYEMRASLVEILLGSRVEDAAEAEDLLIVIFAFDGYTVAIALHVRTATSSISSISASR